MTLTTLTCTPTTTSLLSVLSTLSYPSCTNLMSTATNEPRMPPANSDLATTWAFLEEGVDHILTKLHTGVSYSKYMSLYTVAYNYCTSSRMHGQPDQQPGAGGRSSYLIFPLATRTGDVQFNLTDFILSTVYNSWREFDGLRLVQQSHQILCRSFEGPACGVCLYYSTSHLCNVATISHEAL